MKNKLRQGIQDLALLIRAYSLFYIPGKYCSPLERIPQAMRLFPLWGALSGGLLWAAAWVLYPGFFRVSALVLLAMDLLLGGAYILLQFMLFVDRRALPAEQKKRSLFRCPAPMLSAVFWLLLLYSSYHAFLPLGSWEVLFFAQVYSRWFFCFSTRILGPIPGSPWQGGFPRDAFHFASLIAVLCLLPGSSWVMLFSIALSGGVILLLLGMKRIVALGLRESFCGAAAGLVQVFFLWSWICFAKLC